MRTRATSTHSPTSTEATASSRTVRGFAEETPFSTECGVCDGPGAIYECGCDPIPDGDCDCEGNQVDALGFAEALVRRTSTAMAFATTLILRGLSSDMLLATSTPTGCATTKKSLAHLLCMPKLQRHHGRWLLPDLHWRFERRRHHPIDRFARLFGQLRKLVRLISPTTH